MTTAADPKLAHDATLSGFRGAAALVVFGYHCVAIDPSVSLELGGVRLNSWLGMGWLGVYVFFGLSACLLTQSYLQSGVSRLALGGYLVRRIARCFPAFWVQLILISLAILVLGYRALPTGWDYWSQYLMNFGAWPYRADQLVGVWWTLPVEFGFYMLLPLLLPWLRSRWLPALVLLSFAVTVGFRYASVHWLSEGSEPRIVLMSGQLPGLLDVFVAGCLVPLLIERTRSIPANLSLLLGVAGVYLCSQLLLMNLAQYWSGHWSYLLFPTLVGYSIGLALVGVLRGASIARALFGHRVGSFYGDISYGLYLWHMPVLGGLMALSWFRTDEGKWLAWPLVLSALFVSTLLAWLSWRLIERPCIVWAKSKRSSRRAVC